MMVVEDDPFADILPPMTPRLAALDHLDRVLYVGTFSKTLLRERCAPAISPASRDVDPLADRRQDADGGEQLGLCRAADP